MIVAVVLRRKHRIQSRYRLRQNVNRAPLPSNLLRGTILPMDLLRSHHIYGPV